MIIPEMLKNAPMFKRIDPKSKVRCASPVCARPCIPFADALLTCGSYNRQRAGQPASAAADGRSLHEHRRRRQAEEGVLHSIM